MRGRPVMLVALGLLTVALTVAAGGCGGSSDATAPDRGARLLIVTTVAPITSIVASIAGDRADVHGIVPEGSDSHTFEPRPSAAELLADADVVYVNGLRLEDPTTKLAGRHLRAGAEVVALADRTLPEDQWIYDDTFPEAGGRPNPHLWTDPLLARRYAEIVRDDLAVRDPTNADRYAANYERFDRRVTELDTAMRAAFATIPKRELLTYHDAYAYFARDYGWTVLGAIQMSDLAEPSPREVADLIDQVRATGVPAIFGSEMFPSPVLEQIARETQATYVDDLRDDDLPGEPGHADHSWLGLMRSNSITMTEALGGDASALRALRFDATPADLATYPQ